MANLAIVKTPDVEKAILLALFRETGAWNLVNIQSPCDLSSRGNRKENHADIIITQAGEVEKGGRYLVVMKRNPEGDVVDTAFFNKATFLQRVMRGQAARDIAAFIRPK